MNDAYWANRMRILEEATLDTGYEYVQNLEQQYDTAIRSVDSQIAAWYQRFATDNKLSLAEAKKLLTSTELKEFKWTVEEYIKRGQENAVSQAWLKQLKNASARVHVSRLDSLKIQLQQQAELLHGTQSEALNASLTDVYESGYYHVAYELQKGIGVGWSLHGISDTTINKVLARPWTTDAQTFSDRIWKNKDALVNSVNTQLTQTLMRGAAPDKAIKAIADRFKVSKSQAGRLVMTETAAFANMARRDCFKDLGVEQYIIIETLDAETCPLCGALDGKIFPMSDYVVGTTAPPFHPWCRGTTAPYFEDLEGIGDRAAKDADGKTYDVPKDMTYNDWAKKAFTNPVDLGIIKGTSPKDCTDFTQLTEYFQDEYGASIHESVTKLHFESVQQSLEGIDIVAKEFPLAKHKLSRISTSDNGVMSASSTGTINFNPEYYNNPKNLSSMIAGSSTGFHPKNTGILETGSHEMGHLLESVLIDLSSESPYGQWNNCTQAKRVVSQACKLAKKTTEGKGLVNRTLQANISRYAMEDASECLAEAVADYVANGDNASTLSKQIWTLLKAELGG